MNTIKLFKWGLWHCAYANSANTAEIQDLLRRGEIDGVGFNESYGFDPAESALISDFPHVKACIFVNCEKVDLGRLNDFDSMECLSLGGQRRNAFDFRAFPTLRDISFDWNPKDAFPPDMSNLTKFRIWKYKPLSRNLSYFPEYRQLDFLELVESNLESLEGIERLTSLSTLNFSYGRNFRTIAALTGTKIVNLDFEACSKIEDLAELRHCEMLKSVRMGGCGEHKSLDFIEDCKNLEEFRFVRTNFLDGNMAPLLRLKSVGFQDKKHFSHTSKQINAAIASRLKT